MNSVYVGNYPIDQQKALSIQLRKIPGIVFSNVLGLLTILNTTDDVRVLRHKHLSEDKKNLLESFVQKQIVEISAAFSNRKNSLSTEQHTSVLSYDTKSAKLLLAGNVAASIQLSKKRLSTMNCLVGRRTKANRKVHGQKTKSTGRKTKILKGFQKRKNEKVQ